jgi:peptidoglycan/xylan/chitin deacetylase (PgdA/CDA1 family)
VPVLALTFDDGPDAVWTPRLLDVLARARARATFFPIARRAVENRELMARMVSDGHAIGLHCDEHVRHSSRGIEWCRRDTGRALARLRSVGIRPSLWRTPWGDLAPWSERVAIENGLRLVGWTVDTHDWRGDRACEMLSATESELTDGAIVLAHDGLGPGARRQDVAETIEFVARVASHSQRYGLELEALA